MLRLSSRILLKPIRGARTLPWQYKAPTAYFSTDVDKNKIEEPQQYQQQPAPPSLIKYGLASTMAYSTTYLSFLGAIYLGLDAGMITPSEYGIDTDLAIEQV